MDLCGEFGCAVVEALGIGGGGHVAALDVETEQLLGAADDAGLGDGGERGRHHAYRVYAGAFEDGCKFSLLGVAAPEAAEKGLAAEACEIHGDVGCAAGTLVAPGVAENGNGCLWRDALDVAVDVAVKHDVADDEHLELTEAAFQQVQN